MRLLFLGFLFLGFSVGGERKKERFNIDITRCLSNNMYESVGLCVCVCVFVEDRVHMAD